MNDTSDVNNNASSSVVFEPAVAERAARKTGKPYHFDDVVSSRLTKALLSDDIERTK